MQIVSRKQSHHKWVQKVECVNGYISLIDTPSIKADKSRSYEIRFQLNSMEDKVSSIKFYLKHHSASMKILNFDPALFLVPFLYDS